MLILPCIVLPVSISAAFSCVSSLFYLSRSTQPFLSGTYSGHFVILYESYVLRCTFSLAILYLSFFITKSLLCYFPISRSTVIPVPSFCIALVIISITCLYVIPLFISHYSNPMLACIQRNIYRQIIYLYHCRN